jgi:medium-chain acyl-[acyl-carrier-protein] hydrolase
MTTPPRSEWILRPRPAADPQVRLFCIPFAGRGASFFARWWEALPATIDVCAIQLPGRENRLHTPPLASVTEVAAALADAISGYLDVPYALLGHSMGALVAFELARTLDERGQPPPIRVFVSAHRAPHLPSPVPAVHALPDGPFLDILQTRYGAIPAVLRRDADLMAVYLKVLRADIGMVERYQFAQRPPLRCPISAFGGDLDRLLPREALEPWREHTTGIFSLRMMPGDHFFIASATTAVQGAIVADLEARFL